VSIFNYFIKIGLFKIYFKEILIFNEIQKVLELWKISYQNFI